MDHPLVGKSRSARLPLLFGEVASWPDCVLICPEQTYPQSPGLC